MKEVTHYTNVSDFPSGLKTADEISSVVHMDAKRLIDLADRGVIPHWKIDGGQPLFRNAELKKWIAENATLKCEGSLLPLNLQISPLAMDADKSLAPIEIRELCGLKKIPQGDYAPCVYFLCKNDRVVYVGQSISVAGRISTHTKDKDFDEVYLIHVPKESLNEVESAFIRHLSPVLNGRPPINDSSKDKQLIKKFIEDL